ncbi:anthrone oxygenase family protein [Arthrobacter sp. LAR12-1-1.1]|uniref:anthrone oxygenase family protein n=1 Tax=Arthrobacter sp. LAR12-1-1.1 TaxID=3135215 RepID=UPI00341A2D3F
MSGIVETAACAVAAVGAGAAGGVYLAFSAMVMPALNSRPAGEAVATMQRINEMAVRPPFMTVFFGGALASAVVAVSSITAGTVAQEGPLRVAGAGLALAGVAVTIGFNVPRNNALAGVAVTIGFNVPRNNALARIDAAGAGAADSWRTFERAWNRANTVRCALSIAGAAALAASLAR